ncbi:hypothetical protein [Streptomyces tauricus]|uniref:hypothetical protein n=1 Tax=Streptomyces tauricus TaxID=68274 RepID=UPI003435793D
MSSPIRPPAFARPGTLAVAVDERRPSPAVARPWVCDYCWYVSSSSGVGDDTEIGRMVRVKGWDQRTGTALVVHPKRGALREDGSVRLWDTHAADPALGLSLRTPTTVP